MNPDYYGDLLRAMSPKPKPPRTVETTTEVREVYAGLGTMPVRRDVVSSGMHMHFDGSKSAKEVLAAYFGVTPTTSTTKTEEKNMDRTAVIESRLAELENELAQRKVYGEDDYVEGTVLKFRGDHHVEGGTKYTWAAVKAGGTWHVTGNSSPSNLSWSALVDFLLKANVTKMWLMSKADRLI